MERVSHILLEYDLDLTVLHAGLSMTLSAVTMQFSNQLRTRSTLSPPCQIPHKGLVLLVFKFVMVLLL